MHRLRPRKPSPAMVVAVIALVVALGGTASAAFGPSNGDRLIKKHSLSGNRLRNKAIGAAQIDLKRLGRVPRAAKADTATNAVHATSATTATNADQLGGSSKSAFQSRVTGTCGAESSIAQVNADGSVGCSNVKIYSGRLVEPRGGTATFLTIPGVAHAFALGCGLSGTNAGAALFNDAPGTTDIWVNGDAAQADSRWYSEQYSGSSGVGGAVYHLGEGSGAGAKVITVTISSAVVPPEDDTCIYQGTAEVVTTS
jgi:hypothetical protein